MFMLPGIRAGSAQPIGRRRARCCSPGSVVRGSASCRRRRSISPRPEMRSRVLGVLSVCIGIGPIGFMHLGLLADAIGAPWATAATGGEGILALVLTRSWWRPLALAA